MLIGALGCNVAWGIIDAILYLMGGRAETNRGLMTFKAVRKAADPQQGQRLIAEALPPIVADALLPADLEAMRRRLVEIPEPPARALRRDRTEWRAGIAVFLLVFLSTFPVTIPFMLIDRVEPAMRVSNAIAIVLLFGTGFAYGRIAGRNPMWMGFLMVLGGAGIVAMTIALGG